MVPQLLLVVGGVAVGGIEPGHHVDHLCGSAVAFGPILDLVKVLGHALHVAAVFRYHEVVALGIVF
jgi:hypothetical protein